MANNRTYTPNRFRRPPVSHAGRSFGTDRLFTESNTLHFPKSCSGDPLPVAAALHGMIIKSGYSDIVLDFSEVEFFSPSFMLPLVTLCRDYRSSKIDFEIKLPRMAKSLNLLVNSNWGFLILPEKFSDRSEANQRHLSALQFKTADDHFAAVDKSMNLILQTAAGLKRDMLKALEWALNEVSDNVLNHSESKVGGILQVITFPIRHRVDFYVVDSGVTIPASLRSARFVSTDEEALGLAITEGVTRNSETNQGNGLYGTSRIAEMSGGEFEILSGNAHLTFARKQLRTSHHTIPFKGTFVKASIDYSHEKLLEKALIFNGKPHTPANDFVDRVYSNDNAASVFVVKKELHSFGSREAGRAGRIKITNLMEGNARPVICDFSGISLISSSFADEVFGKLFVELGPLAFSRLCQFQNVDSTVRGLIDRAVLLRIKQTVQG